MAFHQGDQTHQMTHHTASFAPRQFGHIGVFLLRHDGRTRGEAVCQLDESKVLAHPNDQLFRQAADVHHAQRGRCCELDGKVAVAHRIQAVLAQLRLALGVDHAQGLGDTRTVQRVGGASQCSRPQGQAVDAVSDFTHALFVPREHFHIRQQVVRQADGLRHLQMGETGHHGLGVLGRNLHQSALQVVEQFADGVDFIAQPQAHIGRHLVVAAAAGVQALACVAHQLGQPCFDVEVNVFEFQLPLELAAFNVLCDLLQAALDVGQVLRVDDALRLQHLGMGQAASDVSLPQALVEKHAGGVALHQLAHGFREQGGPSLGFAVERVGGCHAGILGVVFDL